MEKMDRQEDSSFSSSISSQDRKKQSKCNYPILPPSLCKSIGSRLHLISLQFDHHRTSSESTLPDMKEIGAHLRQLSLSFDQRIRAQDTTRRYPQRQRHPAGHTSTLALDPSPSSFYCNMEVVSRPEDDLKKKLVSRIRQKLNLSKIPTTTACTLLSIVSCLIFLQIVLIL